MKKTNFWLRPSHAPPKRDVLTHTHPSARAYGARMILPPRCERPRPPFSFSYAMRL